MPLPSVTSKGNLNLENLTNLHQNIILVKMNFLQQLTMKENLTVIKT